MKKIVLVTGGFDPLHSGHIAYFQAAKMLGDELWVGMNSDAWLTRKKGRFFMGLSERTEIINNLIMVNHAFAFDDNDDSANNAISHVIEQSGKTDIVIFANGGDRNESNIPEVEKFNSNRKIKFKFGVGGENKKNSSSWVLDNWINPRTERKWGYYRVFDEKEGVKVKELVIAPQSSLSDQRHFKRSEHWYILEGSCKLLLESNNQRSEVNLNQHDSQVITKGTWHKAINQTEQPCSVLEVQYGEDCIEEDIERRD